LITKILVPIDGSELADKALYLALDQAEKFAAEILVLGVIPPSSIPPIFESDPGESIVSAETLLEIKEGVEAYHNKVLSEAIKKSRELKPGVKISSKLTRGKVADRILETAEEGNFDMIVMGSHGLSGFKEFLLGSVSNQVVQKARSPVLIVK
jgi:nucleotide-binding universal stress UspA family protein